MRVNCYARYYFSSGYCTTQKSCACEAIAAGALNATIDITNATYAGLNDSAVNTSLLAIGNYDQQTIINTCKGNSFKN